MTGFAAPAAFALAAVVVALIVGYLWAQRRRRRALVEFTGSRPVKTGSRWRHVPPALVAVAMLLLIVGLAGPTAAQRVPRNRAVVVLILDTSPSMEAKDVIPSRLAAARTAAESFVRGLPKGINLGLVTFAGVATVDLSPTTHHDEVINRIRAATVGRSTATGDALAAALTTVRQYGQLLADDHGPAPSRVIMLSDGKQNTGRPADEVARTEGRKSPRVPVDTISYGTDTGVIDMDGQRIKVPPNDDLMRAIATATGGQYHKATTAGLLTQVYRKLGDQIGYETVTGDASRPWFLAGAAAVLAASVTGLALTRRIPG